MKKRIVLLLTFTMVISMVGWTILSKGIDKQAKLSATKSEVKDKDEDVLYKQENDIIASHKETWDKVFASMDKSAANNESDYVEVLKGAIEAVKDQLDENELKILEEDLQKVEEIEKKISKASKKNLADNKNTNTGGMKKFPTFEGKDLDGNKVDDKIFSKNKVTLVNFWFNGCSPCVAELPALNKLNESIKKKGGSVIGINTETLSGDREVIDMSKTILKKQGVSYQNIYFDSESKAGKFASTIEAFPTSVLVDQDGNIIGEPIVGGIDNDKVLKEVEKRIDDIIANSNEVK